MLEKRSPTAGGESPGRIIIKLFDKIELKCVVTNDKFQAGLGLGRRPAIFATAISL